MHNCSFIKAFSAIFYYIIKKNRYIVHCGFFHIAIYLFITSIIISCSTAEAKVYVVQTRSGNTLKPRCKVQQNSELHVLMDRICLLCHEMFSHERPNMRSDCRSNCFRTEHFRKCLAIFNPGRQGAKMLLEL
uniref:Uncharacterized protein n=1 Tax=Panagrolaimus sp. PS1159 TaxID=55785 RepID=A0AC35FGJ3_9BILA